jgi:hypothetical protein
VLIISNNRWTLYFEGWRPRVVKTWRSGVETCILKGTAEQQVEELKARLRYVGVNNEVTRLVASKKKLTRKKPTAKA